MLVSTLTVDAYLQCEASYINLRASMKQTLPVLYSNPMHASSSYRYNLLPTIILLIEVFKDAISKQEVVHCMNTIFLLP